MQNTGPAPLCALFVVHVGGNNNNGRPQFVLLGPLPVAGRPVASELNSPNGLCLEHCDDLVVVAAEILSARESSRAQKLIASRLEAAPSGLQGPACDGTLATAAKRRKLQQEVGDNQFRLIPLARVGHFAPRSGQIGPGPR